MPPKLPFEYIRRKEHEYQALSPANLQVIRNAAALNTHWGTC